MLILLGLVETQKIICGGTGDIIIESSSIQFLPSTRQRDGSLKMAEVNYSQARKCSLANPPSPEDKASYL